MEPVRLWRDRSRLEKLTPVRFTCCSSVGSLESTFELIEKFNSYLPARLAPVRLAPVNTLDERLQPLKLAPLKFEPVRLWRDRSRFEKSTPLKFTCCSSVGSLVPAY